MTIVNQQHQCVGPASFLRQQSRWRSWCHRWHATATIQCCSRWLRAPVFSTSHAIRHCGHDKQCSSDPQPTWLLKTYVRVLAPFLCRLVCWSLENGCVPSRMKSAHVTPILKKAGMDTTDPKSYRPISNLSVLSKLLERRGKTACSVPEGQRPAARPSVRIQGPSLNWNRCAESSIRHFARTRLWRFSSSDTTWDVSSVWQCRSCDTATAAENILWYRRFCHFLVYVVP